MVRMRYVGRCLLVLLLIGFGGLLAHVTVTDVSSGGNNAGVDGALGAGVILGGSYHVDLLMKIQMRPVPVKEFQARLRTVRNKFDLLRIFLADKDISDESLMRLLTASMLSSSSRALVHPDIHKIPVASSMDDVDAEFSSVSQSDNLHIQVAAGDDERRDSHLLGKEGLSKPSRSKSQNVTRKDNESADSGAIKEKPRKAKGRKGQASLSGKDKSGNLPKKATPSSKKNENDLPHTARSTGKSETTVKSRTVTVAYEEESVSTDSVELAKHRESQVDKDMGEDVSPTIYTIPDVENEVRENTSPSRLKMSTVESDVTENTSPSSVEVSDVRSEVRDDASPSPSNVQVSEVEDRPSSSIGDIRDGASPSTSNVQVSEAEDRLSSSISDIRDGASPSPSNVQVSEVEDAPSSSIKVSDVKSDKREHTSPSTSKLPDVRSGVGEEGTSPSTSSYVQRDTSEGMPPASSLEVPEAVKNDILTNTPSPPRPQSADDVQRNAALDEAQLAEVYKRAEPEYDDDDYPEDEEVREEDYLDGEVDYYNDAAHADAILEELEEAVHHIAEMENNPHALCRHPLPQVVYIEDPKQQNRQFYPECTVIHRCRNDSGCCGRNYECGPKYEQVIFRTFLAVTVNETSHTVLPDARMVERIALVNHTECHCREKPRLPDCNQACPGVFRMYRYGSQCVCDCQSSANERFPQCDDVKEGLRSLSQDDLVCIKSGKCGVPRCSSGQLDVSTGFCPLKDVYSMPSSLLRDRLRRQYQQRRQQRSHYERVTSPPPRPSSGEPEEGSGDL